jgi:hypothetical protein
MPYMKLRSILGMLTRCKSKTDHMAVDLQFAQKAHSVP